MRATATHISFTRSHTTPMSHSRTITLSLLATILQIGCGGDSGITAPSGLDVASVVISPGSFVLRLGQSRTPTAEARNARGEAIPTAEISWSSTGSGVATVSADGLVSAVAVGIDTIIATSEGHGDSVVVTVTPVPVSTVTIAPSTRLLYVAQSAQLTATTKDSVGGLLIGREVTWASSDSSVATVSAAGLVTAVRQGSSTVKAFSEGRTGSSAITVTVVPVASVHVFPAVDTVGIGETLQLTAEPRDSAGTPLTGRKVDWTASPLTAIAVDTNGLVHATGPDVGVATVSAAIEGKNGNAQLLVRPPTGATITLTTHLDTIRAFVDTVRLDASVLDSLGTPFPNVDVRWESSGAAVLVDSTGLVRSREFNGEAWVRATAVGLTDSALIVVKQAAVGIAILSAGSLSDTAGPALDTLRQVNSRSGLHKVKYRDRTGHLMGLVTPAWGVQDTMVATVTTTGLISARNTGATWIRVASIEGYQDSVRVTVAIVFGGDCGVIGGTLHPEDSITTGAVWGKSTSPHFIVGGLGVVQGAVLTIEPGARVCATSSASLSFTGFGRLSAVGTPADPIQFGGSPMGAEWRGMLFATPDPFTQVTSQITHAVISGARELGVRSLGAHRLLVDSVAFVQSSGVFFDGRGSRISYSTIDSAPNGSGAGIVVTGAQVEVSHVALRNIELNGLQIFGTTVGLEDVSISGCGGAGIDLNQGSLSFMRNVSITGCIGHGIHASEGPFGLSRLLEPASGVLATGNGGYPFEGPFELLRLLAPDSASLANLTGNLKDTLVVTGGVLDTTYNVLPLLPWILSDTLFVKSGGILKYSPGAQQRFMRNAGLRVDNGASIDAIGTQGAPIRFLAAEPWKWGGIQLLCSGTVHLAWIVVEDARTGIDGAAPTCVVVIEHGLVRRSAESGILLRGVGSLVYRSTVDSAGMLDSVNAGIVLGSGTSAEGVLVSGSSGSGVSMWDATSLSGSQVTGSRGAGIRVEANDASGIAINGNNLVANTGPGVVNMGGLPVNAQGNWWGDSAGPNGATGDGVSGLVDFANWLMSAVSTFGASASGAHAPARGASMTSRLHTNGQ